MDIQKLRIDKYDSVKMMNFPSKYALPIKQNEKSELQVIIYYINEIDDVAKFIDYVKSAHLSKDNRVIFVYEKGRKDGVNRDTIFDFFEKEEKGLFKMRSPMLCSLSAKLSAFVQSYEG